MTIELNPISTYRSKLIYVLLIKACVLSLLILFGGIQLAPDEAQYWTWSQALDWGYYSKPPGIAWQIWFGTTLFGSSEWGIRFPSVCIAIAQSLLMYQLAMANELKPRSAFWCGLLFAFSPLGILGSFLATTDGLLLIFWTLAMICLCRQLNKKQDSPYPFALCILCGALFKWTIYFLWPIYLFAYLLHFSTQNVKKVCFAICLSLIGLLPSFYWNLEHDWATFKHVLSTLQGGSVAKSPGNFWEFLGGQTLLISPILFFLMIQGLYASLKKTCLIPQSLRYCSWMIFFLFIVGLIFAFFQRMQGNWIVFVYPTAFVILAWFCLEAERDRTFWMKSGLILSVFLSLMFFGLAFIFAHPNLVPFHLSQKMNPIKHNLGWKELETTLTEQGYNFSTNFLFSDKYQTTSELSFYSEGQKRAYFMNLKHARRNQFMYWPSLEEQERGRTGYYVYVETQPHLDQTLGKTIERVEKQLKRRFERVTVIGFFPLVMDGEKIFKGALIIKCENALLIKEDLTTHF